jgi:hypothetical protein
MEFGSSLKNILVCNTPMGDAWKRGKTYNFLKKRTTLNDNKEGKTANISKKTYNHLKSYYSILNALRRSLKYT